MNQRHLQFESNQSGIETFGLVELRKLLREFESNQSGIETRHECRPWSTRCTFESNQSGIETLAMSFVSAVSVSV